MFLFEQVQHIPASLKEAWRFFSNPENLAVLTPPDMQFKMLDEAPGTVKEGLTLRFKVNVMMGIHMNWTSVIQEVEPESHFSDLQVEGPFKYWHHQHYFEATETGVKITDKLYYLPPMGIIGKLFHPIIVKKKLEDTFQYRYQKIKEVFEHA